MSSNLNGVVLSAPTEDPNIDVAGSFVMTIYGTYVGGGGASTHSLWSDGQLFSNLGWVKVKIETLRGW